MAIAAAAAVIVGPLGAANPAFALPDADAGDPSAASARIVNLDADLLGGLNLAAIGDTFTSSPSAPGTPVGDVGSIQVGAINDAIRLDLGTLNLPLLSDGSNDGLLDLGDAGLLSSYSISPSATQSTSAAGVLGEAGAIDTGAVQDNTSPAHLELTDLLTQLGLEGLTADLIDQVGVEIGTLAARADKNGTTLESEYALADLELNVHSPLVGNLSEALTSTVNGVVAPVNGIVGEDGVLSTVLTDLSTIVDGVNLLLVRLNSDPTKSTLAINGLDAVVADTVNDLLAEQISNTDGSVVVDLSTGTIHVDLAELVIGDNGLEPSDLQNLSELPANTEVLTADVVSAITAGVTESLVGDGPDSLATKLNALLNDRLWNGVSLDININASGEVNTVLFGWQPLAEADITISGTLAQFTGKDGAALTRDNISTDLDLLGVIPVGDLLNPIVAPLLGVITGNVTGPLLDVVTEDVLSNVQSIVQSGLVEGTLAPLLTVLEPVLEQLVSIRINEQPTEAPISGEGDLGEDSFTVRALSVTLLPTLDAVKVDLASATVKAADAVYTPELNASSPVTAGEDTTLTSTGWPATTQVAVHLEDADSDPVGGSISVTTDAAGAFPANTTLRVPTGTPAGTYTVLASDADGNSADTTIVVDAADDSDVNANASASAAASANADDDSNASAQAAAQAAAQADATSAASAAADASAAAAAQAAATADASTAATADATSAANANAAVAAQAAAQADNSSDANADATAAANANASAAASAASTADSSNDASADAAADVDADADADPSAAVNANASASAAASANADDDSNASAQAAAQAAAQADATSAASAAADASAAAAAQAAATADASTAATADVDADANASAAAAAQASAQADNSSDANADATAAANANASAAASAASTADSSNDASADAAADVDADADPSAAVNANASASAAASANADDDSNASAQAAAQAAAQADATSAASAAADASAAAAAQAAATADASTAATADATSAANANAAVAAQAAAQADNSSDANADATAAANANASAAASAASSSDASSNAAADSSASASATASASASAAATASADASANGDADANAGSLGIDLKHKTLERGDTQVAVGTGFKPGEVVTGVMSSTPLALGTQVADADGTVTFSWTIPAGTALGSHTVTLTGAASGSVSAAFQVVADGLATTGGGSTIGWIGLGALLLMLGLGTAVVARRRIAQANVE